MCRFDSSHCDGGRTLAAPCASGKQVLLLEDEEAILHPVGTYFRALGCSVDLAREPEEAAALVSHRHYDLAIVDVRATRFGGQEYFEVLRAIRRRDRGTRIIVVSAYVSPEMEQRARALGADAVLPKPQSLHDLARLAIALMGTPIDQDDSLPFQKVNG
jgi:CheY-like chemotaxis protein